MTTGYAPSSHCCRLSQVIRERNDDLPRRRVAQVRQAMLTAHGTSTSTTALILGRLSREACQCGKKRGEVLILRIHPCSDLTPFRRTTSSAVHKLWSANDRRRYWHVTTDFRMFELVSYERFMSTLRCHGC